ncbi:hypothetical protein HN803_03055 [candidate division WWE3 bacterium]|jgi:hypothetical protein|nr:hypothetical protein [candidate division WWE3 bacterium]
MAKILIEIDDTNFNIGTFVAAVASNSKVTVNIFTSEDAIRTSDNLEINKEGEIVLEDKPSELTEKQLLNKLANMPDKCLEQTLYAEKLHVENKITWKALGETLGIGGDSIYRRVQAANKQMKDKSGKGKVKKPAKKVKAKPKPAPKKPDVPNLTEADIIDAVYSCIKGKPNGGVHFSTTISQALIVPLEKQYAANKKLTDAKSGMGKKVDDAMNKIALVLGPKKCMVTRSREANGSFTIQLMVYTKNIPTSLALTKALKKAGLL